MSSEERKYWNPHIETESEESKMRRKVSPETKQRLIAALTEKLQNPEAAKAAMEEVVEIAEADDIFGPLTVNIASSEMHDKLEGNDATPFKDLPAELQSTYRVQVIKAIQVFGAVVYGDDNYCEGLSA